MLVLAGGTVVLGAPLRAASHARELDHVRKVDDGRDASGPLDISSVAFGQRGRDLEWRVSTRAAWSADDLAAEPGRHVCLLIRHGRHGPPDARLCVQRSKHAHPFALHYRRLAGGKVKGIRATVRRDHDRSFDARFSPGSVGLGERGRYGWRVETSYGHCDGCTDVAPDRGLDGGRLVRVRPLACVASGGHFARYGSRRRRVVALTFDDGPWTDTPRVLDVLERRHVPGTFFAIGRQVADGAGSLRRELRDGDVVGNHTWDHRDVSGGGSFARGEMESTSAAIHGYAGFDTCVFRAPYNDYSGAQIEEAWRLHMKTVQYDVDPADWSRPGSDAIYSRVVDAVRPGSIVLLHDGGGDRSETVAALPRIIDELRRRGYAFATVTDLLGMRVVYGRG